jgi:hypothetical protein
MSETITPTIRERIEKGAAWLDSVKPTWRDLIDIDSLDLGDTERCVLGQVFHDEYLAADEKNCLVSGFGYVDQRVRNGFMDDGRDWTYANRATAAWHCEQGFEINLDTESYLAVTRAWQHYIIDTRV